MSDKEFSQPELFLELLRIKVITPAEAIKYYLNYKFFQNNSEISNNNKPGKWVESLNQKLVIDDTLEELKGKIESMQALNRKFMRNIG